MCIASGEHIICNVKHVHPPRRRVQVHRGAELRERIVADITRIKGNGRRERERKKRNEDAKGCERAKLVEIKEAESENRG